MSLQRRREIITEVMTDHQISERRACRVVNLSRSARHYQPRPRDDEAVIQALKELEVRRLTHQWIDRYNHDRPHDALGGLTPIAYQQAHAL